jgi:hypothetical protein
MGYTAIVDSIAVVRQLKELANAVLMTVIVTNVVITTTFSRIYSQNHVYAVTALWKKLNGFVPV